MEIDYINYEFILSNGRNYLDKNEFVEAINIVVHQSNISALRSLLDKPPGRKPREELISLSSWFKGLSATDQDMVMKVANVASRHATFEFLCVLDGVTVIEDGRDKGELNLYYKKGSKKVLINDQEDHFLHDLIYDVIFNGDK